MFGGKFVNLVTSPNGIALFRIVVGEAARFPELGASFYATGPKRLIDVIAAYLKEQDRKGTLTVPDAERAAMQFLDLAKSGVHLRLLLGVGGEATEAEKEDAVRQAGACFLRVYEPRP